MNTLTSAFRTLFGRDYSITAMLVRTRVQIVYEQDTPNLNTKSAVTGVCKTCGTKMMRLASKKKKVHNEYFILCKNDHTSM